MHSPPQSIGIALGALAAVGFDAAEAMRWSGRTGFAAVQLSATQRGTRSFEMDEPARRGVRAALAANGLQAAGVDFLIPPEDWTSSGKVQRVVDAFGSAAQLAEVLGRVPLVACLPDADPLGAGLECVAHGARRGVPLVHVVGAAPVPAWLGSAADALALGVDTAESLLGGRDPVAEVAAAGARLAHLRVADVDSRGQRGAPGVLRGGRLEWSACLLAASLSGRAILPVLEPAGWLDPLHEAEASLEAMASGATMPGAAAFRGRGGAP